jgi:hypothetical protein
VLYVLQTRRGKISPAAPSECPSYAEHSECFCNSSAEPQVSASLILLFSFLSAIFLCTCISSPIYIYYHFIPLFSLFHSISISYVFYHSFFPPPFLTFCCSFIFVSFFTPFLISFLSLFHFFCLPSFSTVVLRFSFSFYLPLIPPPCPPFFVSSFIYSFYTYFLYSFILVFIVFEALCYKPEDYGFDTRWGNSFLSIYLILLDALGPGIYLATNRNMYQRVK